MVFRSEHCTLTQTSHAHSIGELNHAHNCLKFSPRLVRRMNGYGTPCVRFPRILPGLFAAPPQRQAICHLQRRHSMKPSSTPSTSQPSVLPSTIPSTIPTGVPTLVPSLQPSPMLSVIPSMIPSNLSSTMATPKPSSLPTSSPTKVASQEPTRLPSSQPSSLPTNVPSALPSTRPPSLVPTSTQNTSAPTPAPTVYRLTFKPIIYTWKAEFVDDKQNESAAKSIALSGLWLSPVFSLGILLVFS